MDKNTKFKNKATKIHGSIYDYSEAVYVSVEGKVKIICPHHGPFYQSPRNHIYKKCGCNSCAVDRSKITNTKTTEHFIREARSVHGHLYDYSLVRYKNATTPVDIICRDHGVFRQIPSLHTRGNGCKKCAVRLSPVQFVERATILHENKYGYEESTYTTGKEKVEISCPTHGPFMQRAESHLQGVGCPTCSSEKHAFTSQAEVEISKFISDQGFEVITNTHSIIPPREIDIFIPEKKLAIEFDGIFWHSELSGKERKYHLQKTIDCANQNVRLVHIFEHEWTLKKEVVLSRISNILGKSQVLYARNCNVVKVTTKEAHQFSTENHIQGHAPASVYVGLEHDNRLVALMSFGHPRFTKNVEWELIRFSNVIGHTVVGGASKLFKWFVRNYNPHSVLSYSDKRWSVGNLYQTLGFTFQRSSLPNYFYFSNNKTTKLLSRNKFQKHKLSNLLVNFDSEMSEWDNMKNNGYNRIWDCGNDVWLWLP